MASEKAAGGNEKLNQGLENQAKPLSSPTLGGGYEIRFKGLLDSCWCQWFEGWSLSNLGDGEVLLTKSHVDQSELHGVLNKIRDLNLTLLSVSGHTSLVSRG